MALPSQTARNVMGQRAYSRGLTRRAARRNVQLLLVAILAGVACIVYAGWRMLMPSTFTEATPPTLHAALAEQTPPPDPEIPFPAPASPVVVDVQGSHGPATPVDPVTEPFVDSTDVDATTDPLLVGSNAVEVPAVVEEMLDPAPAMPSNSVDAGGKIPLLQEDGSQGTDEDVARADGMSVQSSPYSSPDEAMAGVVADPSSHDVAQKALAEVRLHLAAGRSVHARVLLSRLLENHGDRLEQEVATIVQRQINSLSQRLLMSRSVVANDPLAEHYDVPSGDTFGKIGQRYKVPYRLLMDINGIAVDTDLRAGQEIKVVRGPFHAIITKHAYRMDIFAEDDQGRPLFVASFAVGLGADDSTPSGVWLVCRGKQTDPDWRNPRTNEYFAAGDPKNPIGEYWIPIQGADEQTKNLNRYGIHGTVDPNSIGEQVSMGCIRLRPGDIMQAYRLLAEDQSRVMIRD